MNDATLTTVDPKQQIKLTKKFNDWCTLFLDKKSDTYGNATQSAIKAYKLKRYGSAGQIGYENLKKLENLGLLISEQNGITATEWHKILASKAVKGTYEQTADYMQKIGLIEKDSNVPANQVNQQFNFGDLAESFAQARRDRGLDKHTQENGATSDTGAHS